MPGPALWVSLWCLLVVGGQFPVDLRLLGAFGLPNVGRTKRPVFACWLNMRQHNEQRRQQCLEA